MRSEVNDFFDVEFANMRQMIIKNELDPLSLPCDEDTFDITVSSGEKRQECESRRKKYSNGCFSIKRSH